ncbi:hypothetical protein LPJ61_004084 [Coemansia biformis]|uniref:Uncharacterized protein n=1 Tax=Coemansia biformis TaxID=1286918 RepID=A0A9W7YBK7_9FUNG|nr:hypothetical protein LPJ61_004084 [Coemansia biformis]
MHEADDFGDFLHSETVDNVWPHPEQPLSDGDHDQHGKLDTSQQPAPLAGSGIDSTPDSATDELAPCTSGADSAGPRGEKHDPINIAASQLLEWISGPGVPEDRDTTGPDAGPLPGADALAAWASAEGLMGGSDLTLHLGEIASRLCSIVPPWPQHVEPADMDQKPITVSLEPVYNTLGPATVVDAVRTSTDGTRLNTLAYNLVWPMYADHGPPETCTSEDDGLVNAYMRLAENLSRP